MVISVHPTLICALAHRYVRKIMDYVGARVRFCMCMMYERRRFSALVLYLSSLVRERHKSSFKSIFLGSDDLSAVICGGE